MVKIYLKTGEEREYVTSVETKSDARLLIINELEKTNQDTHYFSYAFEGKETIVDYGCWPSCYILVEE
jgi:hypothetical protein